MQIDGAVAVITGGASGIGRATVFEMVRRGASVVAADIHLDRLEEVRVAVEEMGGRALTVRCDVAFDDHVEHLRHEVLEEFGRVDIMMNNAGVAILGPPETISMEDWDWMLQVNLFGVIRGVRAFLPHMMERGSGHIVNTASLAGLYAYNWDTIPYITGKFGVVGLTEGLALYAKPHGVGVSLVCPGLVETNLGESARVAGVPDGMQWMSEMPLKNSVSPETIATQVCDAVTEDRFIVLSEPDLVTERMQARANDYDAYIDEMIGSLATPPNVHQA
jgi:NAD(P)-dependent dehydrogenase (short-subunit alcohol dehydrogenase family)